ncbi:amidohydrolase [Candidatus Bipolaricaulota bacterium]|nr:amidohydrolase [Candidatus Bipolaricaulota bacterium]
MGIVLKGIAAALGEALTVKRVDIRIEGNKIEKISESPLPVAPADELVSGEGKLAIPGFVNLHTHLPMVLFRGAADDLPLEEWLRDRIWPLEARLTDEAVYWGSLLGLAEMIRSGTTAFSDMYFHLDAIERAVAESGMRAVLSYGIIAAELDAHGKEELARAEETVKRLKDGEERMKAAVAPHSIYTCGREVWKRAVELALEQEVPIHTHLSETQTEVADCYVRHRMSPVELLQEWGGFSAPTIAAHCVHVTPSDVDILARHRVTVAHCPRSNAKLGNGIAPISRLRSAGVNVGIGTDGAASNNSLDMASELRFAALSAKAASGDPTIIPAQEAVQMATVAGARALGLEGTIAEGNRADIAIVDLERVETIPTSDPLSSLVYSAGRGAVTDVVVDGRFLMRDRSLTTIDEDRVKYEVKKIAKSYKN